MQIRSRMTLTAVAAAGVLAAVAAPGARAAFDVTPLGCAVQPDPGIALAVFGYANPNPEAVTIALGSENLVMQPPNFRAGQPTTFAAGVRRAAWAAQFAPGDSRSIELWWYIQGALAMVRASHPCAGGGAGPEAPGAPRLLRGGEPLPPGAAVAEGDALTVDAGAAAAEAVNAGEARVAAAFERCSQDGCQPVRWGATQEFHDLAFAPGPYVVGPADAGSALRVRLVVATADGWSSALSAPTAVVAGERPAPEPGRTPSTGGPPVPLVQPSVAAAAAGASAALPGGVATTAATGAAAGGAAVSAVGGMAAVVARRGEALVADLGEWAGGVDPAVSGRWERCDAAGGACAAIAGASAPRYVPTAGDVGSTLRWTTTAIAAGLPTVGPGTPVVARAASAPTAVVADGVDPQPPGGDPPGGDPPGGDPPGGDPPGGDPPGGDPPGGDPPGGDPPGDDPPGGGPPGGQGRDPPGGVPPHPEPPTTETPRADRTPPGLRSLRLTHARFRVGPRPTAVVAGARRSVAATARPDRGARRGVAATARPDRGAVAAPAARSGRAGAPPGAAARVPRGTELRFTLGEAAFVRVDVERLRGRGSGRVVATLTRVLPAGAARIAVSGRFPRSAGGALQPGRYRVRVQARDLAGNRSKARALAMRVVR